MRSRVLAQKRKHHALRSEARRDQSEIERGRGIKFAEQIRIEKRLAHLHGDLHCQQQRDQSRVGAVHEVLREVPQRNCFVFGPMIRITLTAQVGNARTARGGGENK